MKNELIKNLPEDFDWNFYLNFYSDLRNAGLKTESQAIEHYLNHGIKEKRLYRESSIKYDLTKIENRKLIFDDLCKKSLGFLEKEYPNISKSSKNKTIIVETRWNPTIEFTIKNTIQKLGDGWGHIIFCNNDNFNNIENLRKEISDEIEIINFGDIFIDRNSYNNLILHSRFWSWVNCEKILIYQSDTFIFKQFDNEFLKWDYIGAPWGPSIYSSELKKNYNLKNEIFVGNGGLSLRHVNAMKEILEIFTPPKNNDINYDSMFEDSFFSEILSNTTKYQIAPLDVASKFSFEHIYYDNTFGCHQPFVESNHDKDIFSKFLKKFKGVNLYGFGNTDIGLGHNMRIIVKCLNNKKILHNITTNSPNGQKMNYLVSDKLNYFDTNLILCNPDWEYERILGENYFKNKYNIALWAWELEKLPKNWIEKSEMFDEIWTISEFCKDVFEKELNGKKIELLNIPCEFFEKRDNILCKEKLGLNNKFVCLFVFDAGSCIERKNPFDVISTFRNVFEKNNDAVLILKSQNLKSEDLVKLKRMCSDNIIIINESFSYDKMCDLFNSCDVYISLHKSEGCGLTIMESINLEIPVICTNYSGNLDFCDENCNLVDYKMINIKSEIPVYNELSDICKWAKPNVEDASKKLLDVYKNYEYHKEKILITKNKMLQKFNEEKLTEFLVSKFK